MAQEEKYDSRCRAYSAWHRRKSTMRFVNIDKAQTLAMIDLDASLYVEYDDASKEPLALIETAQDVGQSFKPATVTRNLARRCYPILPAFIVLYKKGNTPNPAAPNHPDIVSFRVRMIHPDHRPEWRFFTPNDWAHMLLRLRDWSAERFTNEWRKSIELPMTGTD